MFSDCEGAAPDGVLAHPTPATHTHTPTAINATRPPALMDIARLPNCPRPDRERAGLACSQHGKKWESSGNTGRNRGSDASVPCALALGSHRQIRSGTGAGKRKRCYEPAAAGVGCLSIPGAARYLGFEIITTS